MRFNKNSGFNKNIFKNFPPLLQENAQFLKIFDIFLQILD